MARTVRAGPRRSPGRPAFWRGPGPTNFALLADAPRAIDAHERDAGCSTSGPLFFINGKCCNRSKRCGRASTGAHRFAVRLGVAALKRAAVHLYGVQTRANEQLEHSRPSCSKQAEVDCTRTEQAFFFFTASGVRVFVSRWATACIIASHGELKQVHDAKDVAPAHQHRDRPSLPRVSGRREVRVQR